MRFVFQISQSPKKIIPKNYPELEIWISYLMLWAGISNFKFRIVIWSKLFWRFGGLKNELHFLKKRDQKWCLFLSFHLILKGANHVNFLGHLCEILMFATHGNNWIKIHGLFWATRHNSEFECCFSKIWKMIMSVWDENLGR